jgi:hypothetical protein
MTKNTSLKDHEGQRFGKWLIGKQAGNTPKGAALWYATCDCGNTGTPTGADLRAGKSNSCKACVARKIAVTHGATGTRLYRIWKAMRTRCNNPKNHQFPVYGGKGVKICPEWNDFSVFQEWALKNGYADSLSIDRIQNSLGYSPENCRWSTAQQQAENRDFVRRAPDGTPWSVVAKQNGIPVTLLHGRVHAGWSFEEAATLPKGSRRKDQRS